MEKIVYYFTRKFLKQETRNVLKMQLGKAKKIISPLHKMKYGTFTSEELKEEITSRINKDFEILMVHSSYDNMLPMYSNSILELLNVLLSICSAGKTLVMPAFFFGSADYDVIKYYRKNPIFDVNKNPSQMGILSELFRRYPGVKRSLHPTHSICALGPLAEQIVGNHHLCSTTFGETTPFGIMALKKTAILGIGVKYFRSLTQIHCAEDLLGEQYPIKFVTTNINVKLIDKNAEECNYQLAQKETANLNKRTAFLLKKLLSNEELMDWKFHGVPMFYTTAKRITEVLYEAALEGVTVYNS